MTVERSDESHLWANVPCAKTEPHSAHRFLGRCGFPEWCPGRTTDRKDGRDD